MLTKITHVSLTCACMLKLAKASNACFSRGLIPTAVYVCVASAYIVHVQ